MSRKAVEVRVSESRPVRLPPRFVMLLLGAMAWVSDCIPVQAQDAGLVDGLEMLSVYKNVHPQAGQAFDELMKQVPDDVRQKVQASGRSATQTIKTPKQLEDAAADTGMHLVQTPDGLIALPKDKLKSGVQGIAGYAIDHVDAAKMQAALKLVEKEIPEELQGAARSIADNLGSIAGSNGFLRNLAKGGINAAISATVMPEIDRRLTEMTDKIRDDLGISGAEKVLADAQQRAADLKQRAAEEADKLAKIAADKAGADAEAQSRAKAEAERAAAARKTADELARLKADIGEAISELERAIPAIENAGAQCQRIVSATDPRLLGDVDGTLQRSTDAIAKVRIALPEAKRVVSSAQALSDLVAPAQRAADKACAAATSGTATNDKAGLDVMRDAARRTYDGIKGQAEAVLAQLATPVDRASLDAIMASTKGKNDLCAKQPDNLLSRVATEFLDPKSTAWLSRVSGRQKEADNVFEAAEKIGGLLDIELIAFKAEYHKLLAKLRTSFRPTDKCFTDAMEITKYCKAGAANDELGKIGVKIAEATQFEKFRSETHRTLSDLLNKINSDYTATTLAIDRGQTCIVRPADVGDLANPSKAKCDASDLRNRAAGLRNPKFSNVPGIKDKAAELERLAGLVAAAEADYERSRVAYFKGDTKTAIAELGRAKSRLDSLNSPLNCSSVSEKIAESTDRSERLTEALERGEDTLRQCVPATMQAHMQAIEERANHPALTALKLRMAARLAAQAAYARADAAFGAGDTQGARNILARIKSSYPSAHPGDCAADRTRVDALDRSIAEAELLNSTCKKSYDYQALGAGTPAGRALRERLLAMDESCNQNGNEPNPGGTGPNVATAPPPPRVTRPPPLTGPPPTTGPAPVRGAPPVTMPPPIGGVVPTAGPTKTPSQTQVATAPPSGSPTPKTPSFAPGTGKTTTSRTDCDPTKVAKVKPKTSDGFTPMTLGDPNEGRFNPDCPPFGAAAKGVDDGAPMKDSTQSGGSAASACSAADTALARGREHYLAGRVTEYRVALATAERGVGRLNDAKACTDQRTKIAKGTDQADLLEKVVKLTDQALEKCETQQLRTLSGKLGKTKHPHVTKLRGRIDRMAAITVKVREADAALEAGEKDRASTIYREAAAGLNADPGACRDLAERVRDAQEKIRTASDAPKADVIVKALNACQARLGVHGVALPDPDTLTGYTCDCADPYEQNGYACVRRKSTGELAEAAHDVCRKQFGSAAFATPKKADYKQYTCSCGKGHVWNKAQSQCVQQNRAQIIADANRRCQIANKNKSARAAKYLGNGQWSCVINRTKGQVLADAHRSCQRANRNRRARAARYLGNGQWSCYIPGHQQRQPNYDAAASAAAAGAILQGIGAIIGSQSRQPRVRGQHLE